MLIRQDLKGALILKDVGNENAFFGQGKYLEGKLICDDAFIFFSKA